MTLQRDIVELTRHVISVESVLATYEERDSGTPFNGNAVGPFGSGTGTLLTQTEPAALVNRPSEVSDGTDGASEAYHAGVRLRAGVNKSGGV
eukprot:79149-Chlamydomonas_euryale.AAC.1